MITDVIPCSPPSSPSRTKILSRYFGIRRGTIGRGGLPILGIAIHCLKMSLPEYDKVACSTPPSSCHASVHYAIDIDGVVHQYVLDENISWGFQSYPGNFPDVSVHHLPGTSPYPGWPWLDSNYPGRPADYFVLNIGIAIPPKINRGENCPCEHPGGLSTQGYEKLVQLLAHLCFTHSIPIDSLHVAFHEEIEGPGDCGVEECLCVESSPLLNDVQTYCERCDRDSSFQPSSEITWIYGENSYGCRVRIHIDDFKRMLSTP